MRRLLLAIGLTGCAAAGVIELVEEPAPEPSPWVVPEDAPPAPEASVAELEEILQAAVYAVLEVNPTPLREAYAAAMAGRDARCPDFYQTPDGAYWFDSCVADSGAEYTGFVFTAEQEGVFDPGSGYTYDLWYVTGGATVFAPGGAVLDVGGTLYEQRAIGPKTGPRPSPGRPSGRPSWGSTASLATPPPPSTGRARLRR